jgi:DNA-directed RNA polymerase specialized sigma24 family protein
MSGPPADAAITLAVKRLRSGDDEAAAELWKHYFEPLVRTARKRLSGNPRGMADEEDVALSVFKSFCLGMPQGRFAKLKDRRDLWTLLLRMLERKAVDHWRHETRQRRGGGAVRSETALDGADGLDRIPGPESLPQLFSASAGIQHN